MIAKNDEAKRSLIWRVVMILSTVLVVGVATYFLVRIFVGNPLEGQWKDEEQNLRMTIEADGVVWMEWLEGIDASGENQSVSVQMSYLWDKETKTFSLHLIEDGIEQAIANSEGTLGPDQLETKVRALEATYGYSVENGQLTLTDLEYGTIWVFDQES